MAANSTQRKLTAILAADVAGYSRLTGADEEGTLARIRALRSEVVDPVLAANRGRVANTAGDSLLVEFARPSTRSARRSKSSARTRSETPTSPRTGGSSFASASMLATSWSSPMAI